MGKRSDAVVAGKPTGVLAVFIFMFMAMSVGFGPMTARAQDADPDAAPKADAPKPAKPVVKPAAKPPAAAPATPAKPATPAPAAGKPATPPAGASAADPQQPAQDPNQPILWVKLCSKDPEGKNICLTANELPDERGQIVASVALREIDGDPKKMMLIAVPPLMLIQPGLRVSVDKGKQEEGKFTICFPNACYAEVVASDALIQQMKKGTSPLHRDAQHAAESDHIPLQALWLQGEERGSRNRSGAGRQTVQQSGSGSAGTAEAC